MRDLTKIKREGLVEKYEARFLRKLVPLAIRKLEKALKADDADLDAVKIVLARFDRMLDHKHERELAASANDPEDSLAGWYAVWSATHRPTDADPVVDATHINGVDDAVATGGSFASH